MKKSALDSMMNGLKVALSTKNIGRAWCLSAVSLMAAGVSAAELLMNRSFDQDGLYWEVSPTGSVATVFATPGEANLHIRGGGWTGTALWQNVNMTNAGGATAAASITLHKVSAPAGNTIAVYLEYLDAGSVTNRLRLFNPDNAAVSSSTTFSTNLTLPPAAQRIVRLSVDKTLSGEFHAEEFSLDVTVAAPPSPFTYVNTNGTITITGYTGPGGLLVVPATINGLPVTIIGDWALSMKGFTSVTLPASITHIGYAAFYAQPNLKGVYFQGNAPTLGDFALSFSQMTVYHLAYTTGWPPVPQPFGNVPTALWELPEPFYGSIANGEIMITGHTGTSGGDVVIPGTINGLPVTGIGHYAFAYWDNLTSLTIPATVTFIGPGAFSDCINLKAVYFQGNVPEIFGELFDSGSQARVYHLQEATGWPTVPASFGGRPTAVWYARLQTGAAGFGVNTNHFGFNVTWASGKVVVIEASTNLTGDIWVPLQTNTIGASGSIRFDDPSYTNHPARIYRTTSPSP